MTFVAIDITLRIDWTRSLLVLRLVVALVAGPSTIE